MSTDPDFPTTRPLGLAPAPAAADLPQAVDELIRDLGEILLHPPDATQFLARLDHLVDRKSQLMQADTDGVLFVLFQKAQYDSSNYSAAHALRCAVLCRLCAGELRMRSTEASCLVGAALTMNIAMTAQQDELAVQAEPPTPQQRNAIRSHAVRGRLQLATLGITNQLWLDTVAAHHEMNDPLQGAALEHPAIYLPRVLGLVDGYAARLTPRASRQARAAMQLVAGAHNPDVPSYDAASAAIVKAVGVCPPGTYVNLVNGEIAVVLKQGRRANQPLVASVQPSGGSGDSKVRLMDTAEPEFMVNGSVLASDLDIILPDYRKLVRLLPRA